MVDPRSKSAHSVRRLLIGECLPADYNDGEANASNKYLSHVGILPDILFKNVENKILGTGHDKSKS